MKNLLFRIMLLVLTVAFSVSSVTFAAGLDVVISRTAPEGETVQKLIVSGSFEKPQAGERATLKIYKKSVANPGFSDYLVLDEAYIGEDGVIAFEPEFYEEPDTYAVVVSSFSGKLNGEIYVPDIEKAEDFIGKLNNGELTAKEAAGIVAEEADELAFDDTVFAELSPAGKNAVLSDMMDEIDGFDIENIYESFARHTLLNGIEYAENDSGVEEVLEYYDEEYLKLSELSVNELKETLNSTKLSYAYGLIKGADCKTVEEVREKYTEAMILSAYKNIDAYANLYDILADYAKEIGIEDKISTVSKGSTKANAALRYLVSNKSSVNSLGDLKSKFIYAVENTDKITGSDSTAPSGGGGGGGAGGGGGNVSVAPGYVDSGSTDGSFSVNSTLLDLNTVPWAEDAIRTLFIKGIVNGRGDGNFAPNDKVTRAEMAKMLVQSMDIYDEKAESKFADTKNHWSNKYVASAYKKGFINGISAELFGADYNVTRQDAAVMVYRAIQINAQAQKVPNVNKTFTDISGVSDYAVNSVKMLAEYGIINGFEDGSFRPAGSLTRAEAAVIINKYLEYVKGDK